MPNKKSNLNFLKLSQNQLTNTNILKDTHYDSLLTSLKMIRNRFIFFLLFLIYLFLGILSTSDKMLYMQTPIKMPLLNLDLPIVSFYILMPLFVLALQFNLLYVINQYKERLLDVNKKYKNDIASLPFGLYEGALFLKGSLGIFLKIFITLTVLILPSVILTSFWFRFSDYQSYPISNWHFITIILSVVIGLYFSNIFGSSKKLFKTILKYFLSFLFIVSVTSYHYFIIRPFSSNNVKFTDLESLYSKIAMIDDFREGYYIVKKALKQSNDTFFNLLYDLNIKNVSVWFIPRLIVTSELLIPLDKELLETLKDLDSNNESLLLYSPPFNQEKRNFRYAIFDNSIMIKTNLKDSNMQGASLQGTNLQGTQISDINLTEANLRNINLEGNNLRDINLNFYNLKGANLKNTYLGSASLIGVNFEFANLEGANLERTKLKGSNLSFLNLQGTSFHMANLQGTNLANARLQGADFSYAYLQGADLSYANLSGANLSHAKLQGTILKDVNIKSIQSSDPESFIAYTKTYTSFIDNCNFDSNLSGIDKKPLSQKQADEIINDLDYLNKLSGNISIFKRFRTFEHYKQAIYAAIKINPIKWVKNQKPIFGKVTKKEIEDINISITNPIVRKRMGFSPL